MKALCTTMALLAACLISCKAEQTTSEPQQKEVPPVAKSPKDECEELMDALLPIAEKMLSKHGEFHPYGGSITKDGEVQPASVYDGRERPPSNDLINMLASVFQEEAEKGSVRATAIVYDALVTPPGATEKTDAIIVCLDHQDGYSAQVCLPYTISETGELTCGEIFAVAGKNAIFGQE